jgi:predicted GH43/DUF377 family glycosyl hydrolase
MSIKKPRGFGYSPCEFTFNPAYFDASRGPGLTREIVIVRASSCTPDFGGAADHLLYAECASDGTCKDLQPLAFNGTDSFGPGAEDPRVFVYNNSWYLYYYTPGPGQQTVSLRKTTTPLVPSSWTMVAANLNWHRNGCVIIDPYRNGTHLVIWGETSAVGIGISSTTDFATYVTLNSTWLEPNGPNSTAPEVVLEAATPPVQLSTGDYLHIYAAGTPGWVANGNYTGGFVILDKDDPTKIIQRGARHVFVPTMDYEIGMGTGIWPVNRNRTLFVTALVPVAGETDTFRAWWGAADANVATGIVKVTYS